MSSLSPRAKTPRSRTPPPVRPESPTPFPLTNLSEKVFRHLSEFISAFELCSLWWTGSKRVQELMSGQGGASYFLVRWRKPSVLPTMALLEKLQGVTVVDIAMELPADWPSLSWEGLKMESLSPRLERLRLVVPDAIAVLVTSGPMFAADDRRYAKRIAYFDFDAHLPALRELSLHERKSGPANLASPWASPSSPGTTGSEAFAPLLPKKLTSLSLSPFHCLSESFIQSLPPSLTLFSQGYHTTSHEEPLSDWKQPFGAALRSLTLRSPIQDLHRWLPRDLTSLDVSQGEGSIEPMAWKKLPRNLTFIGLPELSRLHADDLIPNLPPKLTHIHVSSKVEVNDEMAQALPSTLTRMTGHIIHLPESFKYLNPDFEHISVSLPHDKPQAAITLPPLPPRLRSLYIKGSGWLDPAVHPLKGLTSLRLENWNPPSFDPSFLPTTLLSLVIEGQSHQLQFVQVSLLPRSITELTMSLHHPPSGLLDFDGFPLHLQSLRLEIIPAKRKTFSMTKAKLGRNLPPHLRSLALSGRYKLFLNEWIDVLPPALVHLELRPKELHGSSMHDALDSKLTSQCFASLPRNLSTLAICINDVMNDSSLARLPRGLEKLSIEKSPPSNSIITSEYTKMLPPNVVEVVLPQSTSVEYIPLRPNSPAPFRRK